MNEYLEAEKETGIYEAAQESGRGVETVEERSARRSLQVVAKRGQPSPSEGGSSRKKARRRYEVEAPSLGVSRPEAGLETMFSADDESEEEGELTFIISLRHRNRRDSGPAVLEAAKEPVIDEEPAAAEKPKTTKETERVIPP